MPLAAITGASGLLGGNLAAELLAQGWTVRATRRGSTKIGHLEDLAIAWVPGDLDDVPGLTAAFAGADAVFHCAAMVSIVAKVTPPIRNANVGGTERVLAAMRAAKAKRLVHVSSVVAVGVSTDGKPSDETARWNLDEHGLADAYSITKREAEDVVRAATDVDAVIVNPGYMLGPRDARPSSGDLLIKIAKRKLPGSTPGTNDFVDVRDVARGMILAAGKGARGERYILGGEQLGYREAFDRFAKVAGVAPPRFSLPRPLALAFGYGGDAWHKLSGKEPLVNSTQVRYAFSRDFAFTSAKAERVLGYQHGPIEPAVRDALAWFRAHRML
jgi:dihydroflavonol-4-reductase